MLMQYIYSYNPDIHLSHEYIGNYEWLKTITYTLREESSQTNVILQYKLLAAIVSAVCNVIQQS